ncbi:hypothetical protein L873DRAFT_1796022 [Choiromyces venosus 120613-1]|uniref:Small ribosomal subunit protein mS38 n=1 Tax=Choiromyces venosus 120613-1 TaxID=1336337 RepID=A0A3N4IXQ4_9PEZI|nr:hypothetical protein L873DRAFT_1796022 [Choiromyces venosus 120613-1]
MFSLRRIALSSRFGGAPAALQRPSVLIKQTTSPAIPIQTGLRSYSSSSSSNPSNPSDGTSGSNIAAVRRSTRTGIKNATTSTAAKERSKVPVVPSTDHLHPADVAVSAFFAQHRPVSISHPVPLNHSETLFGNIFASRKPTAERPAYQSSPSPADFEHVEVVIESGGLESAIRSASSNAQQQQQQQQQHQAAVAQPQTQQPTQDAADSANMGPDYFAYRPFHPPPPPRAQTAFLRPRLQKQLIQLLLQATAQGEGTVAISGNSKLLLERMIRQKRIGEAMCDENPGRVVMRLISVKRIRKLKMKKHKLRKLRKRTRSLRRRIESQKK